MDKILVMSMACHFLYAALNHDSSTRMKIALRISEFDTDEVLVFVNCLGHLSDGLSEQIGNSIPVYQKLKKKLSNDLKFIKSPFLEDFN